MTVEEYAVISGGIVYVEIRAFGGSRSRFGWQVQTRGACVCRETPVNSIEKYRRERHRRPPRRNYFLPSCSRALVMIMRR